MRLTRLARYYALRLRKSLTMIADMGYEALVVMLVGGFCLVVPPVALRYYGTLPLFRRWQRQRIKKSVLN